MLIVAGGLGTLFRYSLSELIHKMFGSGFPFGTMFVNVLGCFVVGILMAMFESKTHLSNDLKTIVLVGFIGAFTTFSTYIFETQAFMKNADWHFAALNLILQNVIGIACLIAGMKAGEMLF